MPARRPLFGDWLPSRGDKSWPPGGELYRCHHGRFQAGRFNDTDRPRQRFSPIHDARGLVVPTWYAASTEQGAVAETILHDIPVRSGGMIVRAQYRGRVISTLLPARPLHLVRLDTDGLRALRVDPVDATDTEADAYPRTSALAQHLHDVTDVDGLAWVSRRRNIDCAVMLFGDRVGHSDLVAHGTIRDLDSIDGWRWLAGAVGALGIEIQPPV